MRPNSSPPHHHSSKPHRSTGSSTVTSSSGTPNQACAACKYQRRRCNPDCILAPYFPADHQRQFLNAHHLFGVRKILKAVQNLEPKQQAVAMQSIMFHSDARALDPIGGCYRIILGLERQIVHLTAELDLVNHQLALCRGQAQAQHQLSDLNVNSPNNFLADNEDTTIAPDTLCNINHVPAVLQQQQQQQLYSYNYGKNVCNQEMEQQFLVAEDEGDSKSPTFFPSSAKVELKGEPNSEKDAQEHDLKGAASLFSLNEDPNSLVENVRQENDLRDAAPLFTLIEEPNSTEQGQEPDMKSTSFFTLKEEPNASELVREHDLKGAASLFSLTNFNTSTA